MEEIGITIKTEDTIPVITETSELLEDLTEEDLYSKLKKLQRHLEFLELQEDTIDRELLKPSSSVALHRHSNSLVDVLPPEADSSIAMLGSDEKPDVTYSDVGGLDIQSKKFERQRGPRMVRDVFRLARENSPSIIFIDEIDCNCYQNDLITNRADREVQRILLELLNQMDGFDQTSNVKVIMATNRADTLDPALLRPGRLDRKD
ncbi:unnamed protein product [Rhizophagus irregularis]|nr:unnamed protein product [Rhizophagus irregularis]